MPHDGFLNLIKPPGMTSHDLVAWIRTCLRIKRAGHLGTLDPAAAGVLPVSIGRATRLFRFAGGPDKAYRAEVIFGISTDTLDAEGRVLSVRDSTDLTEDALRHLLTGFVGEIKQVPPAFSAARVGGRRLHELARDGELREGRPRGVKIAALELLDFLPGRSARALIDVVCSTGTYVRVLAHDLGRAAGCGAYLGFLVRTRAGRFELCDALTIDEFAAACDEEQQNELPLPLDWPLQHLPKADLAADAARAFVQGTRVCAGDSPAWPVRVYGPGHSFLGLGEVIAKGQLSPRVVLASQGSSQP